MDGPAALPSANGGEKTTDWHPSLRFGLAVMASGAALGASVLLRELGDTFTLAAPFFGAIVMTVWYLGIGPGIATLVLSAAMADWFFFTPYYSLTINPHEIPSFFVFLLGAAWAVRFSDARRRARDVLRRSRDLLEAGVRERTREITRVNEALEAEIAQRRRAEEAMLEARAELARATRVTTVGGLAASVAHEINQPLAAVVANGSAALRWIDRDPPELAEALPAIRRVIDEGHRASQIVARIRGLVRKDPPARTLVDLNGLISETVALCRHDLGRKLVDLDLRLQPGLPVLLGDKVQLQQVLLNLVLNALEAMEPMLDPPRKLTVTTGSSAPSEVWVSVADTGIGFEPERSEKMFTAFHTTKPHGIGLGLSISRSIVEGHGGRIEAAPGSPRGSVFRFFLPAGSSP